MGLLSRIGQTAFIPIKATAKAAWAVKPLTGAIVGGAYGGLSTDEYSNNQIFRNTLMGAVIGGGIGGLATGPGRRLLGELGMGIAGKAKNMIISPNAGSFGQRLKQGGIARMGTSLVSAGGRIGSFAMNHPYLTTGIAGASYGMAANIAGGMTGGTISPTERDEYLSSIGTSSPSRQMLQDSTYGLTQGLHRSRHK